MKINKLTALMAAASMLFTIGGGGYNLNEVYASTTSNISVKDGADNLSSYMGSGQYSNNQKTKINVTKNANAQWHGFWVTENNDTYNRVDPNTYTVYYDVLPDKDKTYTTGVFIPGERIGETAVKYAVAIWGIKADDCKVGPEIKKAGLTFGPALGEDYRNSYKNHIPTGLTQLGNEHRCVHDDSWLEIVYWSKEDPYVYEECVVNACSKALPIDTSKNTAMFVGNPTRFTNGDGSSAIFDNLQKSYRHWNDTNTASGGWSASKARQTCYSIYDCFPKIIKDNIIPKQIMGSHDNNTGTPSAQAIETTYDNCWLLSFKELGFVWGPDCSRRSQSVYNSRYENGTAYVNSPVYNLRIPPEGYRLDSTNGNIVSYDRTDTSIPGWYELTGGVFSQRRVYDETGTRRDRIDNIEYNNVSYCRDINSDPCLNGFNIWGNFSSYADAQKYGGFSPCFCLAGDKSYNAMEARYTQYDGAIITGAELLNVIQHFEEDDICIAVDTSMHDITAVTDPGIGNAVGVNYIKADFTAIAKRDKAEEEALIRNAKDATNNDYINPSAKFYGKVKRNNTSGVIQGINFFRIN